MSEEIKQLTKDEAVALVGGVRETIHCFLNPGGMLLGADWNWHEFETALEKAERIEEAGDTAKSMKHPLALFNGGKWQFFEAVPAKAELPRSEK